MKILFSALDVDAGPGGGLDDDILSTALSVGQVCNRWCSH
jgi:hypothetical protein